MKKDPFVILISGAPGTGKTTLAIKIAESLGIDQMVSTDIVRSVLKSVSNEKNNPLLFSVTHDAWRYFGEKNFENMWRGFSEHCDTLFPTLKFIIEKSLEEGRKLIIEGAHITPAFVKSLKAKNVFSFLLVLPEDSALLQRFDQKNYSRSKEYLGWKENFDVIRFIESKILQEKDCFSKVLENKDIEKSFREIVMVTNEI